MFYSKDDLKKVKSIDLLTYLKNYEPNELVKINDDNYCTKTHDSLKISNGMWYWFSKGVGSKSALDYLIIVNNYSLNEAVGHLLKCLEYEQPTYYFLNKKDITDKFVLPKANDDNYKIINYLTNRGIDKDIILECIDRGLIYQEKYTNNVVFVGYDKNKVPRYACLRSIYKRNFKESYGSSKAFSFQLDSLNENERLHIFECAIDLLSYATLLKNENKEWYNENLLSLGGVYGNSNNCNYKKPIALLYYLNQHPNIKEILIHFDNDEVGKIASTNIQNNFKEKYKVIDNPPLNGKDFNDFLLYKIHKTNQTIDLYR